MPVLRHLVSAALAALVPGVVSAAAVCAKTAVAAAMPAATPAALDARVVDSCLISARDAVGSQLADARQGHALREALPGAVTFDVAAAAPPFDAATTVALIGEAGDVRDLLAVCARLHAAGYANVRVVAGGIDAWRRADGSSRATAPPTWLGAPALSRRALDAPHALVFDANADTGLRRLGDAKHIAWPGETPAVAARRIAAELARRHVVPGVDPITVVVADRGAAAAWRDAWNATAYPDPQFYVGVDPQYRTDLANAERIAAGRGKPLPGPCDR